MNDKEFDKYIEKYGGRYYPKTRKEFNKKLDEILKSANSYEGAADAVARGLVLMSNYLAHVVGTTGFQHSWAEMQYISVSRYMKMPWMIINLDHILYPQYDLNADLERFVWENMDQIKDAARAKLEDGVRPHPDVKRRWQEIVDGTYRF